MSDNTGKPAEAPQPQDPIRPPSPKIKDAYGRMVPDRTSNRPFTNWSEWKAKEDARRADVARQRKEREERIARGEEPGPEIVDPTEPRDLTLIDLVKVLVFMLVATALAGQFFVGSPIWGYDGKWTNLRTYWPQDSMKTFSEKQLKQFDGTDPTKPIYLALDGEVFDVSAGRHTYGPGGSYHHFAGVDHARAFVTGCFKEHKTHDIRGFTESQIGSLNHWKDFFRTSKKYFKVGTILHPPIDPNSPIPEDCKQGQKDPGPPKTGPKRSSGEF
ncbi:cytochrome b5 [Auriculariales sp. MPI-PUGE-AT-0066]|nr:cytochrome b5 [Auriculariales sp. MPI-PUGE-AT-0066]